jgi:hypothetical protein
MSLAYTYDGTMEGLMTAVFTAFAAHEQPEDVYRFGQAQLRLGQDVVDVPTDIDLALRVHRGICRCLGARVWGAVATASASDEIATGTAVYRFLRYAMASRHACPCTGCTQKATCGEPCRAGGSKLLDEWSNPDAAPMLQLCRHVEGETERMRQFVRFEHAEGDLWFARCNPNASVVPLIMDHFAARFNTQRFMIYDENHHLAGISADGGWELVSTDTIAVPAPADDEQGMQDAWRRFYRALSIESRYNPELRRRFMPKRFWRNITEVQLEAR